MLGTLAMRAAIVMSAGRMITRAQRQREALELSEREALLRRRRDSSNGCRNLAVLRQSMLVVCDLWCTNRVWPCELMCDEFVRVC